ATKDEIIRVAKAKTARARAEAERARARAKAERARAEAEAERARAEAERARAKTAQLDKLHKWLSRWKKNIYAPQAKKELKDIINAYETTYGKGSFFSDKILSPENEKNIKAILNK
nr:hypothetical protein [Flavobacteriaceae bacterium]